MRTLDLGCGTSKIPGAIGVEKIPLPGVDVIADLHQIPYPFANHTFDAIHLNDVIEHLPDTIRAMEELYRLCRPEGRVHIRVINWNSSFNADDPTHLRTFSERTFTFFGMYGTRSYYSTAKFDIVHIKRGYNKNVSRWLRSKKLMYFLSHYLNNILETLWIDLRPVKPGAELAPAKADEGAYVEFLRCPHCLMTRDETGAPDRALRQFGSWLVCLEPTCQRKYPVYDGLAVMTLAEGGKWCQTNPEDLPTERPQKYQWIIPS